MARGKLITPKHVALIPDGNRRWARSHKLEVFRGHSAGIKRFVEFANWSREFGVKTISVWALSTENLTSRSTAELKMLFELYTRAAKDKTLLSELKANKARLRVIGNLSVLPKKLRDALHEVERQTQVYQDFTINLLVNYGGKEDLIYSFQQLSKDLKNKKVSTINEETIEKHLRSRSIPNIDLIVRTSGEKRLSGLLPWQGTYSELYFANKYWPDFNRDDFRKAMMDFSKRQRRFGK